METWQNNQGQGYLGFYLIECVIYEKDFVYMFVCSNYIEFGFSIYPGGERANEIDSECISKK